MKLTSYTKIYAGTVYILQQNITQTLATLNSLQQDNTDRETILSLSHTHTHKLPPTK
jgi:hypothetical protein